MTQVNSGVLCPVCRLGSVVLEVERVPNKPVEMMPYGPASAAHFQNRTTSIHCANPLCMVLFHNVPHVNEAAGSAVPPNGQPDASG